MFPFLFVSLWRILKGTREQQGNQRPTTDVNHNRQNGARRRTGSGVMTSRKRKAYAIMAVSLMGLFIPIALIAIRSLLYTVYRRNHQSVEWESYTSDHTQLQKDRLSSMQHYQFVHSQTSVDKRHKLSLREFTDVYDGKWPVIVSDAVTRWRAYKWSDDFLIKNYGREKVRVKNMKSGIPSAEVVSLSYFLRHLEDGTETNWRYVEDEHFIFTRPELRQDVGETVYVLDDMFRNFPESVRPWDSMLLWGTAHSRSPLHIDPYNWTGTNAVLRGHKKWKLYPPGQDHLMYVQEGRRCHFPLDCFKYNSPVDAFDPTSMDRYPRFKAARVVEVDQYPGEMLFIPSGWFHQAYNVVPTLAISGQVMNVRNYMTILQEMVKANPEIPVDDLPSTFYSLSPDDQVRIFLSKIPKELHEEGERVSREARHHGFK